jgi:hypothetical protein
MFAIYRQNFKTLNDFSYKKSAALCKVNQRRWLDLKRRIKLAQPLHIPP